MKRLFIISLALLTLLSSAAAEPASEILEAMRKHILAKPAVEAKFSINGGQGVVQGSITISGASFTLSTPQIKVWYDGKTQWSYLASSGEVSISEPTAEELTLSNPLAILSSYATYYKVRRLNDNKGRKSVSLTPIENSGIERIVVIADKSGKWPEAIDVCFDDKRRINLVIDKIDGIAKPSDKIFRYDPELQAAKEIIDLR